MEKRTYKERRDADARLGYINRNTRLKIAQIKKAHDYGYTITQVFEFGFKVMDRQIELQGLKPVRNEESV